VFAGLVKRFFILSYHVSTCGNRTKMKFKRLFSSIWIFTVFTVLIQAQKVSINDLSWKEVVNRQPKEWYGSAEAIRIAENVLLYQRNTGGWIKNTPMHKQLSEEECKKLLADKDKINDSTTDNDATTTEMTYLSKVYGETKDERYKDAFLRGLKYLMDAQYPNGGWPQFYPLRRGYYTHITYNDNCMVNIMRVMKDIYLKTSRFSIQVDNATAEKAHLAYDKGLECILKSQYKQNGVLTIWCAQHDENTLLPAKARSYELPSLSGGESAGIVKLLMDIDNPSTEVINSVQSAIKWFENNKLTGIKVEPFTNKEGMKDLRVVADPNAPPVWARFYGLDDNRPFFCDRDGVKKFSMAEIGYERRNGYSWYNYNPAELLKAYPAWKSKRTKGENVLSK
jgi:pectinesterase